MTNRNQIYLYNYKKSNCIQDCRVDAEGNANFLDNTNKLILADERRNFFHVSVNGGYNERKHEWVNNIPLSGVSFTNGNTNYLAYDSDNDNFIATTIEPIYNQNQPDQLIGQYWYDQINLQMNISNGSVFIKRNVLFLAKLEIDGGGLISSSVCYNPDKYFETPWFNVTNDTVYEFIHHIGEEPNSVQLYFRKNSTFFPTPVEFNSDNGAQYTVDSQKIYIKTGASFVNPLKSDEVGSTDANTTTGEFKLIVEAT